MFSARPGAAGHQECGCDHVAWGTTHREEDGEDHPVMASDAHPDEAAGLGQRCRDLGLEPVKMFSMVFPDRDDAVEVLTNCVRQVGAAGASWRWRRLSPLYRELPRRLPGWQRGIHL